MRKSIFKFIIIPLVFVMSIFTFSGCWIFDGSDSISEVRERVETLRREMADKIIEGFKNNDADAVVALLCPKTQELPDIKEQVTTTLTFMDGNVSEYNVSRSTGYEGYSNAGVKVTEYAFGSSVYVTTDADRQYEVYMSFNYIASADSIEGLTSYSIIERDREYEQSKRCCAGYNWSSPCDGEIGILAADLIKAVGRGDAAELKSLLCPQIRRISDIDAQIAKVFEFFDGAPTFTERADGLYNYLSGDDDLKINTIGVDGDEDTAWTSTIASPVCTDSGKEYTLHFVAYLKNSDSDKQGVSWFSLENFLNGDEEVQLGEWIH